MNVFKPGMEGSDYKFAINKRSHWIPLTNRFEEGPTCYGPEFPKMFYWDQQTDYPGWFVGRHSDEFTPGYVPQKRYYVYHTIQCNLNYAIEHIFQVLLERDIPRGETAVGPFTYAEAEAYVEKEEAYYQNIEH